MDCEHLPSTVVLGGALWRCLARTIRTALDHVVMRTAFCALWPEEVGLEQNGESMGTMPYMGRPFFPSLFPPIFWCPEGCWSFLKLVIWRPFFPAYSWRTSFLSACLYLPACSLAHSYVEPSSAKGTLQLESCVPFLDWMPSDQEPHWALVRASPAALSIVLTSLPALDLLPCCQFLPGLPSVLAFASLASSFPLSPFPSSAFQHNGI